MNKKTKPETESLLRIPKAKNKLGLKINRISMPHDDLITQEKPRLELVESESLPSLPSVTRQTRQTLEVSPTKDYQKVANSISKEALPAGLFKGKSKQLYDALYSLTRGAVVPSRSVRIRKGKLMKLSNIGSRNTFDSNILHLEEIGLIKETVLIGEHSGNEFEVFLPEESLTRQTSQTRHAQKLDRLVTPETSQTRQTLLIENKTTYSDAKTSFKDIERNDDEPFGEMNKVFAEASKKTSGKAPHKSESPKWKELAELLVMELEIAAARTNSISNVPAFLTEHLKRRLIKPQLSKQTNRQKPKLSAKPATKESNQISYEGEENSAAEPLSEQGRKTVLETMRDYIKKGQSEFVFSLKNTYTQEDWEWLTNELEKKE